MFKITFFPVALLLLAGSNSIAANRIVPPATAATAPATIASTTIPLAPAAIPMLPVKTTAAVKKSMHQSSIAIRTVVMPISTIHPKVVFAPVPPPAAPSHVRLDSLLQKYVSATGQVNYKGLKADKAVLVAYCDSLSAHTPQEDWSRAEKMAYWINAYNAFTIRLIVDNYPTTSILKFDGGKTWDVKRITLGGKKYSLNMIENEILRPQFKDPRIHFAINCAAKSCPPIFNRAYTAENLETTLETRAKSFINNPKYNTITVGKASVSKIFDWYGADFGDLKAFLNKYAEPKLKTGASVVFEEYNWELNE